MINRDNCMEETAAVKDLQTKAQSLSKEAGWWLYEVQTFWNKECTLELHFLHWTVLAFAYLGNIQVTNSRK